MKVNLILFSLFLLVSIMACNVFAFSISGGVSERSYKETEKTSAMTTTHSTKLQGDPRCTHLLLHHVVNWR